MTDHDPLDELRAAWRDLRAPEPDVDEAADESTSELRDAWRALAAPPADEDPATDALVEDMRAAWSRVAAPAVDASRLATTLRQRARFRRARRRLALAAAVLLVCALVFLKGRDGAARHERVDQLATHDPEVDANASTDEIADENTDANTNANAADPGGRGAADATPRAERLGDSVRARVLPDGSMELRTGRVRLLLSDSSATTVHQANDDTTDSHALPAGERR